MKTFLFLLFMLIAGNVLSQKKNPPVGRLWVGENNTYLKLYPDYLLFETLTAENGNVPDVKSYIVNGDTLEVYGYHNYDKAGMGAFIMDTSVQNKLTLKPLNQKAIELQSGILGVQTSKLLVYRDISETRTDTIEFEKLKFDIRNCYRGCLVMTLQIDNKKELLFIGVENAVKTGHYRAVIPDLLYKQLMEILSITELDKIKSNKLTNADIPTRTLEIHYNNKKQFFRTMGPPLVTDKLIEYILDLPKKVDLQPTDKLTIEFNKN